MSLFPVADRGQLPSGDFIARASADMTVGLLRAARVLADRDVCKTYGKPADPDEQAAYKARRQAHWLRHLLGDTDLLPVPNETRPDGTWFWHSHPEGAWEITVNPAGGTDVYTHALEELQPDQRRALAWALLAVDSYDPDSTDLRTTS